MSQGKYSPAVLRNTKPSNYTFNCFGMPPAPWTAEMAAANEEYDAKTMFGCFDADGYDSYGYSCFDENGHYVGDGNGIDRNGYTEDEYASMTMQEYIDCQ